MKYLEVFDSKESVEENFRCTVPNDAHILLAWYGYGNYCGSSLVIYEQKGKLYRVDSSHCSCNGLEGQWQPEETSIEELRKIKISCEYDGYNEAERELNKLLDHLENSGITGAESVQQQPFCGEKNE